MRKEYKLLQITFLAPGGAFRYSHLNTIKTNLLIQHAAYNFHVTIYDATAFEGINYQNKSMHILLCKRIHAFYSKCNWETNHDLLMALTKNSFVNSDHMLKKLSTYFKCNVIPFKHHIILSSYNPFS